MEKKEFSFWEGGGLIIVGLLIGLMVGCYITTSAFTAHDNWIDCLTSNNQGGELKNTELTYCPSNWYGNNSESCNILRKTTYGDFYAIKCTFTKDVIVDGFTTEGTRISYVKSR